MNKLFSTALLAVMAFFTSVAHSALSLNVSSITNDQFIFSFSGSLEGTPTSGEHVLAISTDASIDWISGPTSINDNSLFSANPMNTASTLNTVRLTNNLSAGDVLSFTYGGDLLTTDTGTGNLVTITLPENWSFNTENLTHLDLSWAGLNVYQSTHNFSAVPLPAGAWLFVSALGGLAGIRKYSR